MSVFVSAAGRANGQSQLVESEDALVHDVALRYWTTPRWSIRDAYAILVREWGALLDAGVTDLSNSAPTYETLRLRARKLQPFTPVSSRNAREPAADRKSVV